MDHTYLDCFFKVLPKACLFHINEHWWSEYIGNCKMLWPEMVGTICCLCMTVRGCHSSSCNILFMSTAIDGLVVDFVGFAVLFGLFFLLCSLTYNSKF